MQYRLTPLVYYFVILARPPGSSLFPYTTLFRSAAAEHTEERLAVARELRGTDTRHGKEPGVVDRARRSRSEEHTSELQSRQYLVCRLLLEKKKERAGAHDAGEVRRCRPGDRPW